MIDPEFTQHGFDVRLAWGEHGLAALAGDCAVLVIVDVLSFSTSTDIAVGNGARILPVRWRDERGVAHARTAGAVVAGERGWTLRPASLVELPAETLLALPSPNGATLCAAAAAEPDTTVLVGCLRNATSVAALAAELADGRPVGVIAAGERWGIDMNGDGDVAGTALRPSVEDLLGAGAIAAALRAAGLTGLSPEAGVAAAAFEASRHRLAELLHGCASGRELTAAGHRADVDLAAQHDTSKAAPRLVGGVLQ